jgi:Holliday junction resolvase RusA-like endonuclease
MVKTAIFTVPGEPTGKARPRVVRGHAFTPEKTVLYENLIKTEYERQCGRAIFEGPVGVRMICYFGLSGSDSRKKRQAKVEGVIRPTKKPDI